MPAKKTKALSQTKQKQTIRKKKNPTPRSLDPLTKAERSERMSRIRGKDTKPEMVVRRLVHSLGYRFRLHKKDLPGKPDLAFPGRKKVIFVHGCFWHLHKPCNHYRYPKTRLDFWEPKLEGNRKRDRRNRAKLHRMEWSSMVIWECQIKDPAALARTEKRVRKFLES